METIARIYTDFEEKFGIPRQSGLAETKGKIIFEPPYNIPEAVRGLEEFSHIWVIWRFSANDRRVARRDGSARSSESISANDSENVSAENETDEGKRRNESPDFYEEDRRAEIRESGGQTEKNAVKPVLSPKTSEEKGEPLTGCGVMNEAGSETEAGSRAETEAGARQSGENLPEGKPREEDGADIDLKEGPRKGTFSEKSEGSLSEISETVLRKEAEDAGEKWSPTVRPPRLGGNKRVGVFATRSPFRPNPIGLSCVKLEKITIDKKAGPVLHVIGADMLNGTPVYDIKPYVPYADSVAEAKGGFSDAREKTPNVEFDCEIPEEVSPETIEVIKQLLKQDPRPAYQNDRGRTYGMRYGGVEIKFKAEKDKITVCDIYF